jgi:DNA repair protein RecO (recombination protein O)
MLAKARGIVLKFVKYRETSIIAHIYTDKYGLRSYLINGIRSQRSKQKLAHFQPLSMLDMVVYHHPRKEIIRMSEYRALYLYQSAPYDPVKSAILWFLAEFLSKCLRTEDENHEEFNFIKNSLIAFDQLSAKFESFHLQFLLKISAFLGFYPAYAVHFTQHPEHRLIQKLLEQEYHDAPEITNEKRRELLNLILLFYRQNMEGLTKLKSLEVLIAVLS